MDKHSKATGILSYTRMWALYWVSPVQLKHYLNGWNVNLKYLGSKSAQDPPMESAVQHGQCKKVGPIWPNYSRGDVFG